jgi:hypothetical protein
VTDNAGVPRDFLGVIQKMIEDAVAKLARSGMLRNASITGGTLTIKEGGTLKARYPATLGGGVGVFFGDVINAGTGAYVGTGLLMQAPNGYDIASFRSDVTTGTSIAVIRDGQQNAVFYTDTVTGQGLGRPYLPFTFYSARFTDTPSVTISATFETLWTADTYKQLAGMFVGAASLADAGTAGEVRVLVNGVQLGTTQAVSSVAAAHSFGAAAVAGAHMAAQGVEIQARVTSGAGSLRVLPQAGFSLPV